VQQRLRRRISGIPFTSMRRDSMRIAGTGIVQGRLCRQSRRAHQDGACGAPPIASGLPFASCQNFQSGTTRHIRTWFERISTPSCFSRLHLRNRWNGPRRIPLAESKTLETIARDMRCIARIRICVKLIACFHGSSPGTHHEVQDNYANDVPRTASPGTNSSNEEPPPIKHTTSGYRCRRP